MESADPEKHGRSNREQEKRALTKREVIAKAKALFGPKPKGPMQGHDKWALFAEWVRTEPSQYKSVRQWIKARHPELHPITISQGQGWGGFIFWSLSRQAFRHEAMARILERSPDLIAKRFESLHRVQGKLEKAIEKIADRLLADLDEADELTGDVAKDRVVKREKSSFNARLLDALKDVQNGLADVSSKIAGNPAAGTPMAKIDLYSIVVDSLKERDERHGVIDVEADRPTS